MDVPGAILARILSLGALGVCTCFSPLAFCATITLSTAAPTIGYGPSIPIGSGGPYFTYTAAPNTALTVGGTALLLNTSTANLGQYTYNSGALSANALNVNLSVTPTVNGTAASTPLVFQGTLIQAIHIFNQPIPYEIDFDPGLNPTAQIIINGGVEFIALPFDGYLFGVDVGPFLSYPAYNNANVALVDGIIAPQSQTPEPAALWSIIVGAILLMVFPGVSRSRLTSRAGGAG